MIAFVYKAVSYPVPLALIMIFMRKYLRLAGKPFIILLNLISEPGCGRNRYPSMSGSVGGVCDLFKRRNPLSRLIQPVLQKGRHSVTDGLPMELLPVATPDQHVHCRLTRFVKLENGAPPAIAGIIAVFAALPVMHFEAR